MSENCDASGYLPMHCEDKYANSKWRQCKSLNPKMKLYNCEFIGKDMEGKEMD